MAADVLEVILLLKNVQGFVAGAQEAAGAITEVGTATETSGKKAAGGWKGMLKWAAGAAAIYGGARFLKSAVDQTDQLAKSTVALTRITGMDTQSSSEWVGLANQRGIAARQLQTGLVKLSKTIDTARSGTALENKTLAQLRAQIDQVAAAGGKNAPKELAKLSTQIASAEKAGESARKVMARLGISLQDMQKGATADVLYKVADAFKTMKDPTERATLAQQVFGRAGVQLLPVLAQGAEGVRKLLDEQKKAGNYLTSDGLKQVQENIKQQRALDDAMQGVKTQLALGLMPVLIDVGKAFVWLSTVLRPVTSNAKAMQVILGILTAGFLAWRAAIVVTTIQTILAAGATEGLTVAQIALNLAMDANVIGIVVLALAALVVGFVYAYKHVSWFRDLVNETWKVLLTGAKLVWSWIKAYWPYLLGIMLGPFALAAIAIYKNFGRLKKWARELVQTIKDVFNDLVRYMSQIPHRLGKALSKIPGYSAATKAAGFVGGALGHVGLAEGGLVSRAGSFLVGERGPELLALPAGAAVSPLPGPGEGLFGGGRAGGGDLTVVVPVYLDGKQVARSVAKVTADRLARR